MDHKHHNDSLYPRSVYQCTECGTLHGTRAYAGAVNWQCPRELDGSPYGHAPAKQEYVGYVCFCGEVVDTRQAPGFLLSATDRENVLHNYHIYSDPL